MNYPTYTNLNLLMYLRKSREDVAAEDRGEGDTLAKHRRVLFSYADQFRHQIIGVFEEVVSGERIIDRPEFQKLLHTLEEGYHDGKKIDGVLCIDHFRLGRGNLIDQGIIQETFKVTNTLIVTPRKIYDLHEEIDEEFSEMELFMARKEYKYITRRLQNGRKTSANEGRHIGKKPPYGYLRNERLFLYPHPEESENVKLIFRWIIKDGMGVTAVANKLTDMGIKTPSGGDVWTHTTISEIIHNEVYIGTIIWGKGGWRKLKSGTGYRSTPQHDRSKWQIKKNAHEPLVSKADFYKAQEICKNRSLPVPDHKSVTNPFASIMRCGHCGKAMRRQPRQSGVEDRLLCSTHRCPNKSTAFGLAEKRLLQILKTTLAGLSTEVGEVDISHMNSLKSTLERRQKEASTELVNLQTQSRNIHDLLERCVYSIETFQERIAEIESRLLKVRGQLSEVGSQLAVIHEQEQKKDEIVPKIVNVLEEYEKLPPHEKNDLLKEIIEKIVYTRNRESKKPDEFTLEVFLKI